MKTEDFNPIEMKMFEQFAPNASTMFTRVPGGFTFGDMQGVCFIPFADVSDDPLIDDSLDTLMNALNKKTE